VHKHFTHNTKVLEIGCNDGTLINFLNKKGYKCFGVDPAKNINQNQNLTIYKDFFNTNFSRKLTKADAYFDIVIGLNVFAHNDSFINMFEATSQILSNEGVFILEVAYAPSTIGDGNFDTIYHEHVCSYSLLSLENALNSVGLYIFNAQLIDTQGGSIRVIANNDKNNTKSDTYKNIKNNELKIGLNTIEYYNSIKFKINEKVNMISNFFEMIVKNNRKLLIIGAPARGVVTMNVCNNFDLTDTAIIIDDTKEKQDKVMPGSHIPVISWDQCDFYKYDVCIILSWNYLNYLWDRLKKYNFDGEIYTPFPHFEKIN
jgi:SAM-dependent methyltransferase